MFFCGGSPEAQLLNENNTASGGCALMTGQDDLGSITINEDVVAHYASLAILEVEGIISISGKNSYSDYVGVKSKDVDKGVSVRIDEATNSCTVNTEVLIEYGVNVYETARKLQAAVKNAVENYVGFTVDKVNVTIRGLQITEQPRTSAKNKAA